MLVRPPEHPVKLSSSHEMVPSGQGLTFIYNKRRFVVRVEGSA